MAGNEAKGTKMVADGWPATSLPVYLRPGYKDRSITSEVSSTASTMSGMGSMGKGGLGFNPQARDPAFSGSSINPKTTWQQAAELALIRAQRESAIGSQAGKIPDGFKPMEQVSEMILPASRRPSGPKWYYSEKRKIFWFQKDLKLYILDPETRFPAEFNEGMTSDFKITVGACFHEDAVQSQHVVVKDVTKVDPSLRLSISPPVCVKDVTFDHLDKPCSIYALYEGHRGAQGNLCAEFCAANLQQKLLLKLSAFRGYWDDRRLETALTDIFQELDDEFAASHPSKNDGCCAMVALLMGQRLVLASLGDVACVVCKRSGETVAPFKAHALPDPDKDDDDDEDEDDDVPEDPVIRWTRAFGDADFKQPGSSPLLSDAPDVAVVYLDPQHRGVALVSRALYNAIGPSGEHRGTAVSTVFKRSQGRSRMASGSMVDAALQRPQEDMGLGSIVAFFDNMEDAPTAGGALKKRKVDQPSQVRLRHILLKHRECKSTMDKVRNKQVTRTRGEAERILRSVLEKCEADPKTCAATFAEQCREVSECTTCSASGDLAGDLGWLKPGKNEQKFGPSFDAAAFSLQVGQLSDLVDSDHGIHIFIRA